jgi:hypothetical protein
LERVPLRSSDSVGPSSAIEPSLSEATGVSFPPSPSPTDTLRVDRNLSSMTGTRETRETAELACAALFAARDVALDRVRGPAWSRSSLTWTTVVMVASTVCEVDLWMVLVARPLDKAAELILCC